MTPMAMQCALSCGAGTSSSIMNYSFPRHDKQSWKEPRELKMNCWQ